MEKVIQSYINQLIEELSSKDNGDLKNYEKCKLEMALKFNALPTYCDWAGYFGIKPDLSFIYYSDDNDEAHEVNEKGWHIISLIKGAKLYPELKDLLPNKSEDSLLCKYCNGTGRYIFNGIENSEFNICGKCFGLGWTSEYIETISIEFCNRKKM
jgi:hypothetical protein